MEATILDLRYKMNDVLKALDRNEKVTVLYRGKKKGIILPIEERVHKKVQDHPLFGMDKNEKPVEEIMQELRGGRYHDL